MSSWLAQAQVITLRSVSIWQQDLAGTSSNPTKSSDDTIPSPSDSPWLSTQFRTLILGSAVPSVVIMLILAHDMLTTIELPKPAQKLLRVLASPFTNFLSLNDLEDEPGPTYVPPLWKSRIMAILSAIQAVVWAAFFCYVEVVGDMAPGRGVEAGVGFMSWVGRPCHFLG